MGSSSPGRLLLLLAAPGPPLPPSVEAICDGALSLFWGFGVGRGQALDRISINNHEGGVQTGVLSKPGDAISQRSEALYMVRWIRLRIPPLTGTNTQQLTHQLTPPPHKTHRPGRLGALDSVDPSIAQHPSTPHTTNGHHLVGQRHDSIIVASRVVSHKSMGKRKAKIGGYGKPGKLDIVFDEQARRCVGWNGLMI